eukprot:5508331-Prymnesium_polylepis.1
MHDEWRVREPRRRSQHAVDGVRLATQCEGDDDGRFSHSQSSGAVVNAKPTCSSSKPAHDSETISKYMYHM